MGESEKWDDLLLGIDAAKMIDKPGIYTYFDLIDGGHRKPCCFYFFQMFHAAVCR